MFSNVGIVLLVVLYTIAGWLVWALSIELLLENDMFCNFFLGAFVFIAIEGNQAIEKWQTIATQRENTLSKLWKVTCCEQNVFDDAAYKTR